MQKSKWGLLSLLLAFTFGGYFSSEAKNKKAPTSGVHASDVSVRSAGPSVGSTQNFVSVSELKPSKK